MGYVMPYHTFGETYNPLWVHTLAAAYPDVTIVLDHGGMQGWWWEHFVNASMHVAASHKNVYLETGYYWPELYMKALNDPNIGPEKLLWGTDWGASIPIYAQPGRYPGSYAVQSNKEGIPPHQVDVWGWALRQLMKLEISQDKLNLILGGNAVRIYNLRTPGNLTRMFEFVD
jgi:predicted TIM-barrel fold metal-dependent hydrolase